MPFPQNNFFQKEKSNEFSKTVKENLKFIESNLNDLKETAIKFQKNNLSSSNLQENFSKIDETNKSFKNIGPKEFQFLNINDLTTPLNNVKKSKLEENNEMMKIKSKCFSHWAKYYRYKKNKMLIF